MFKNLTSSGNIECSIAQECGGCSQIQVPYERQLAAKQAYIEELFAPLVSSLAGSTGGSISATAVGAEVPFQILPILGMENPVRYRNKIVSPFAPARAQGRKPSLRSMARTGRAGKVALRKSDIACGLYAAGTHKLIECENCVVEHEVGRRVVAAVREIMARYGVAPYNEDTGAGFMRHVVVRVGANSGEVLVTLVTNEVEFTGSKNFCRELVKRVPEITTIVQNINTRKTNVIFGEEERVLYGPGFILDILCGLSFRISSNSFFQTNATQTEVLYRTAIDFALNQESSANDSTTCRSAVRPAGSCASLLHVSKEIASQSGRNGVQTVASPSSDDSFTVLDVYCGTGTIGLVAAAAAPGVQVIGVDNVEAAIADARQNAVHNGIDNARFTAEDAGFFMREYAAADKTADVVLMDPPRSGASEEFLQALITLAPRRVVYISCNPKTQVRDCQVLHDAGYVLQTVQPVDMFPHTSHIETVALLTRR